MVYFNIKSLIIDIIRK